MVVRGFGGRACREMGLKMFLNCKVIAVLLPEEVEMRIGRERRLST